MNNKNLSSVYLQFTFFKQTNINKLIIYNGRGYVHTIRW
jgi:hypothetical protein